MKSWSAGDWFQFSSVIAVVIGVVIVVWELQESREIAAAQIATDAFQMLTQQEASMEGDSAAEALAKACDRPDSLTTADMIRLSALHQGWLNRIRRTLVIDQRSDVLEGDGGWQQWAPVNFGLIFSTSFGRWWWQFAGAGDEIKAAGDEVLESMGSISPTACKDFFDGFRRSLANEASQL